MAFIGYLCASAYIIREIKRDTYLQRIDEARPCGVLLYRNQRLSDWMIQRHNMSPLSGPADKRAIEAYLARTAKTLSTHLIYCGIQNGTAGDITVRVAREYRRQLLQRPARQRLVVQRPDPALIHDLLHRVRHPE